jgi:hypothetical protein
VTGAAATTFPIFVAAAEQDKKPLIVSVHDVAPPTQRAADEIINELARRGVDRCSLLVVPNYHRTGEAMADQDFVRWLRDLEAAGHEVVIHGYFHQRPRSAKEGWRARFLTRWYTRGEGEFFDLEYEEALRRIVEARDQFAAAGLKPRGFIAPARLLGPAAERAAADAEMEYTTRLTTVCDLRTGDTVSARSLVYSVSKPWRRTTSLCWNGALQRALADAPLLRLGIHPPDLQHPAIWRQISRIARAQAESRLATTYRDWIAERRSSAARQ